ncbi:MAG: hypothetical protein ACP5NI_00670 [Acetobacteraceae bacterium]
MLDFTEFRPEAETVAGIEAAIAKAEAAMAKSLELAERARGSIGEQVMRGSADDVAEARRVASMARGDAADLENVIDALRAALPAARDREALAEVRRIEAEVMPAREKMSAALAEYERLALAMKEVLGVIETCDRAEVHLEAALRGLGDRFRDQELPHAVRAPRLREFVNIPDPRGGEIIAATELLKRAMLPVFIAAHEEGQAARAAVARSSPARGAPADNIHHYTPGGGVAAGAKHFILQPRG